MMPSDTTVADAQVWLRERGFIRDEEHSEFTDPISGYTIGDAFHDVSSGIVELIHYAGAGIALDSGPHEDMTHAYREVFAEAAACTRDALTIADVAVSDGVVTFRANGQPRTWHVFDGFDDGRLDYMTFVERMGDLTPPGSGRWAHVMGDGIPINMFLFGEPEHLRELSEWGVEDLAIYETG